MDVRLLSLCHSLKCELRWFYRVVAADEGLALEGASRDTGLFQGPPIEGLVFQAQLKEWHDALADTINDELKELAGKDPKVLDVIEDLQKGPWGLFDDGKARDIFATCPALDLREKAKLDRRIPAVAEKILHRKTVLLVPDFSQGAVVMPGEPMVSRIAEELIGKIEKPERTSDIALVRLRSVREPVRNEKSLFEALMKALFSQTTQLTLDDGIHEKEGPLLIEGATGTGKSQAATLLATRLGKQLHEINLAALTDELLESKMRGHVKGAFTGAHKDTAGFFENADGQVLFLDELQSASLPSQTQLLDLLSAVSNQVRISRMGEEAQRRVYTVKVVLATNRPADELLAEGLLREDLFHRIRDIVRFKGLNELLDQEDYVTRIFKLLKLYRWKSFPAVDTSEQKLTELATELLFPSFENGVADLIRKANWPGNFRQFERFAYDLYWRLTTQNPVRVTHELIEDLLAREESRFQPGRADRKQGLMITEAQRVAQFVESVIVRNKMDIGRSCSEFGPYKIKSRQALRLFLNKNIKFFSSSFLNDSKIIKFMKIENETLCS